MRKIWTGTLLAAMACCAAVAQLSDEDFAALQQRAAEEGWTFAIERTPETYQPIADLCSLKIPEDGAKSGTFTTFPKAANLPEAFNWRDLGGCNPNRNQAGCGSCWAFSTVGALECAILIKDGVLVDLSEQWLVSCNQESDAPILDGGDKASTWGCNGGWFAHDYHSGVKTDSCGGFGAVLESAFPYTATKALCGCPYSHTYVIDGWSFIGPELGVADTAAIKQAIVQYGPVCSCITALYAFSAYGGGVFNYNETDPPNHAILLTGWDDTLGENGCWLLKNSWSATWGESGYMWIEYGKSNIGFGANFIEYTPATPRNPVIVTQPAGAAIPDGWRYTLSVEATGTGLLHYAWEHDGQPVGTDSPELTIPAVHTGDLGFYRCVITDILGSVSSEDVEITLKDMGVMPAVETTGLIGLGSALVSLALFLCRRKNFSSRHQVGLGDGACLGSFAFLSGARDVDDAASEDRPKRNF